jgi:outer membrane receptor protein involved in Fe transport
MPPTSPFCSPRTALALPTALAALLVGLAPVALHAQAAPPASAATADRTAPITLSPFEVSTDRDTGYQAASTLAGGRIETALDRTPSAISVLTREFLDDIAANNFTDAAIWSPNSYVVAPTSDFGDFRVDFRSTNQAGNPTVNYFAFGQSIDSFSTERIEFSRGPNSILFGEGNLSGIATVSLKQARFRDATQLQLRVDDLHNLRLSADVNRQAFDRRLAVRVAVLKQDGERWRKPSRDDRAGVFFSSVLRLGDSAALRFEFEYGTQDRSWGEQNFYDNASAWNGTAYTGNGTTAVPANNGMAAIPTNADYWVWNPAHPERGLLNYRGFARSTGNAPNLTLLPEGRPYVPGFPVLPSRDFDIQPPNNLSQLNYYFATLYLEKRFGKNLFVQLAMNRRYRDIALQGAVFVSTLRIDPNTFLPNGQANPDFGKAYVEAAPFKQRQWSDPRDFRLLANYRLQNAWTEQNVSVLASYQRNLFRLTNDRMARSDNPTLPLPTNGTNFIQQRYYLDRTVGLPYAFAPDAFTGSTIGVRKHRYTFSETGIAGLSAQLALVGSYFNRQLSTIVGLRHDDNDRQTTGSVANTTNGDLVLTRREFGEKAQTPSAGLVWYPLPAVGPFVNYSESYVAPGLVDPLIFSQNQPDAPTGSSWEYGFHFKFLGDRIQGNLRHYASVQAHRIVNAPGVANINNIWNTLGQTGNTLPGNPRDLQDLDTTGYEFELTANLTPHWRATMNYALPRSRQTHAYPETKAYRAAHLAEWTAAAATNATIASNLTTLNTAIEAGNDGREQNTGLKYRANLYTSYDFRTDVLKGFGIGGGVNFFGDQIAGNVPNQPYNYIYCPGYHVISSHLNYSGKWRATRYRVQLNVTNLLDTYKIIFTSVARYTAAAGSAGVTGDYFAGYRFVEPRKVTLTTTFDF